MRRVALYIRVSTDKQTTANQRRELEAVAERCGWHVVKVFEDAGISGSKGRDKRPAFDDMLKSAVRLLKHNRVPFDLLGEIEGHLRKLFSPRVRWLGSSLSLAYRVSSSRSSSRAKASMRFQPIGRRMKAENNRRSPSPIVFDGLSIQPNCGLPSLVPAAPGCS